MWVGVEDKRIPKHLRHRGLAAVDDGMPAYRAAKVFSVSVSYIYKALQRRRTVGVVSARAQSSHLGRKLAPFQDALRRKLGEKNDVKLKELQAFLAAEHGIHAAIATIHSELKWMSWTQKKRPPPQRSRGSRGAHPPARPLSLSRTVA